MEKTKAFIIDVDGTIAKIDHRLYLIKKTPQDWEGFYDASVMDEPIPENIAMIKEALGGHTPIFVTGRADSIREGTEKWIKDNFLDGQELILHMRKTGDHREDFEIKKEVYDELSKNFEIVRVYEDRPQVIRMYRELGIEVVDMGPGYEF